MGTYTTNPTVCSTDSGNIRLVEKSDGSHYQVSDSFKRVRRGNSTKKKSGNSLQEMQVLVCF